MTTIFKKIIDREIPADIIYEDDRVLVFLDINPINKGHSLVIPKTKFENIFDGDPETLGYMMQVAQKVGNAQITALGATGVNLTMNNGEDASQEVPHAHIHVIPRFAGDSVFSPPKHTSYEDGESASVAESIKKVIV